MASRRHKRRRIERAEDEIIELSSSPPRDLDDADKEVAETEPSPAEQAPPEEIDVEAFAKEREIWDAFREEHYEVLEQLPLSLHRAFTLIQELDQQAQEHISAISPAILKYVSIRRALADTAKERQGQQEPQEDVNGAAQTNDTSPSLEAHEPITRSRTNGKLTNGNVDTPEPTPMSALSSVKGRSPPPTKSLASLVQSSDSTRELLVGIAQSAEEVARASNEKEYLAQHVYDLVDRYIRDLDRAIKEQEASISLGLRPGTHPASIILPELVLPKANRPRVLTSPRPTEIPPEYAPIELDVPGGQQSRERVEVEAGVEQEAEHFGEEPSSERESRIGPGRETESGPFFAVPDDEIIVVDDDAQPSATAGSEMPTRRGRKRRKPARYRQDPSPERVSSGKRLAVVEEPSGTRSMRSLTLKIPPQPQSMATVTVEVEDPEDNERWCFCNQVSYGEMVACDNDKCPRQWFHLPCVGLTHIDQKETWYCRDCLQLQRRPRKKRRR